MVQSVLRVRPGNHELGPFKDDPGDSVFIPKLLMINAWDGSSVALNDLCWRKLLLSLLLSKHILQVYDTRPLLVLK